LFNRRFEDERIVKDLNNLIYEQANDDNESDSYCSVVTVVKTDKDAKSSVDSHSDSGSDTSLDTVVKADKDTNTTSKLKKSILDYKEHFNKRLKEETDYYTGRDLYDIESQSNENENETELDKHRRRLLELKDPLYTLPITSNPREEALMAYKATESYREEMKDIEIKKVTKIIDMLEKKKSNVSSIHSSCDNPSLTSEYYNERIKKKISIKTDNTDIEDMFTPNTLDSLNQEIKNNKLNLDNIDNISKHDTKDHVRENLLDERRYLLEQKTKHLEGVLQKAKNVPINDIDVYKLDKDILKLKNNIDKLVEMSKNIKYRSLK